jgi:RHS repeat-associated protein
VPFGLPGGDCDSDGDCDYGDTTDTDQIQAWIAAYSYDVRGDLDLDGDVDAADKGVAGAAPFSGADLGRTNLSMSASSSALAGYVFIDRLEVSVYVVRQRTFDVRHGTWNQRDSLGFVDSQNLYEYVSGRPITYLDPNGEQSLIVVIQATLRRLRKVNDQPPLSYGRHCGPNHGNYGETGGGRPVNDAGTDACCMAHDECWHNMSDTPDPGASCESISAEQKACDCAFNECLKAAAGSATGAERMANMFAQGAFGKCCDGEDWKFYEDVLE